MPDNLQRMLSPRTVAVLGASDDPLKPGGRVIDYMKRHGFTGAIYPVSLNRPQVQGLAAFQSLSQVPQTPDLVVVALPQAQIVEAIRVGATLGAAGAVIFASGYAELGDDGRASQVALAQLAQSLGVRLIGPNTQGMANFATGAIAHFGTIIDQLPSLRAPVGIVSQSGAGSQILYTRLHEVGVGVEYLVATGNEADVDVADVALAYAQDEAVRLILIYAESIKHPARLAQAAALARQRGVPMLMVKAGRTAAGQRTAASHTGALASEDRLVDAFLAHHGIVRLADFDVMARVAQVFLHGGTREGLRTACISNSGATCVLSADAVEAAGLTLATFSDALNAGLAGVLPDFITAGNPVDMTTATLKNPRLFSQVLAQIQAHEGADLLHVGFPIGGKGYDLDAFAQDLRDFMDASGVTTAVSVNQDWVAESFIARRIPVYRSEREAVDALAAFARWRQWLASPPPGVPGDGKTARAAPPSTPTSGVTLSESDSLAQLKRAGLPVVDHTVCHDVAQAVAAWRALGGGEVVVKGMSADIAHKSEHGLVCIGPDSEAKVAEAAQDMLFRLAGLGAAAPAVIVAPRIRADFELMMGGHLDPAFGPMVAVGHGGVLVERLDDVQFIPAPCSHAEAQALIQRLNVAKLFAATRGMPAVDTSRVAAAIVSFSQYLVAQRHALCSVDINPILVRRGEHDPVIVDALIETRQERGTT